MAFHTQHAAFEDGEQTDWTGTDDGDIGMLLCPVAMDLTWRREATK